METTPIVVDLGKVKPKGAKRLKKGKGKLYSEVLEAIEHVKAELGDEVDGKELVPVVVIYEKKQKVNRRMRLPVIF
jgi:hypothetical protein